MKKTNILILLISLLSFNGKSQYHQNPLVNMQIQYDAVKNDISSYQFEIKYLDTDQSRAQAIINQYQNNFKQLLNSLEKTKNFRQARVVYNRAIVEFNNLNEKLIIERNYREYNESNDLRLTLVKNGVLNVSEYEKWRKSVLNEYKMVRGANYQSSISYNLISDIIGRY